MSQKIVLLHGMWSTSETLRPLNEVLTAEGFDVHTVDLPGHLPRCEMDTAAQNKLLKMGVNDYVNAVCEYINSLQDKPIVIGHSMGGLIAQLVVGKVECKALITISSAAPAGINGWCWSAIRTLGRNLFRFPLWRHLTALSLKSVRYGIANTQPADVQESIYQNATFESGLASWEIGMWFLYRSPPTAVNYQASYCPVLVIGGLDDKVTPISVQRNIAKGFGCRATLVELPSVCHWTVANLHLPVVSKTIIDWIKDYE